MSKLTTMIGLALLVGIGVVGQAFAAVDTQVMMDFSRSGWLTAPFPSDDLRRADGTIDVSTFPTYGIPSVLQVVSLVNQAHGFSQTGGVFFALTGALNTSNLPTLNDSVKDDSAIFLISVDKKSPDYLKRYPIQVSFAPNGGIYGAQNMLSIVPLQGKPLRPGTTYAAVVLKSVQDANNQSLGVSPTMKSLASKAKDGQAGLSASAYDEYQDALEALAKAHVSRDAIAGIAVFTTDSPLDQFKIVKDAILSQPLPKTSGWTRDTSCASGLPGTCDFATFCVYKTTIQMPDYQQPYQGYFINFNGLFPLVAGGGWNFDSHGQLGAPRYETATIYATVPKMAMPHDGFPTSVFIRTGGGGDRPLVDRGRSSAPFYYPPYYNADVPGTGPASYLAQAGFAGLQVDGPLGGLRNPTGDPNQEDALMFNVFDLTSIRDVIRESAVELVLFAHIASTLSIDASDCQGFSGGPVKFDMSKSNLMGHSMGATVLPLAFAFEPAYKTAILSGAGASWIANELFKVLPVPILTGAEQLTGDSSITMGDPILTMIQWSLEPADALIYTDSILQNPIKKHPRSVLMEQGIVDLYITPPIANAISLSLGLDLAGQEIDQNIQLAPWIPPFTSLGDLLQFSGRRTIALPAQGNWRGDDQDKDDGSAVTAVVVQHPSDGIQNAHEILFQTDAPKKEYMCFLKSSIVGVPRVPDGAKDPNLLNLDGCGGDRQDDR